MQTKHCSSSSSNQQQGLDMHVLQAQLLFCSTDFLGHITLQLNAHVLGIITPPTVLIWGLECCRTTLHWAALGSAVDPWPSLVGARYGSNMESAQLLLKAGAEVKITDDAGCTPMHYAAGKGVLLTTWWHCRC